MLVNYWDLETLTFNIDGKPLKIEVDGLYFIIGLSCLGEVVNLKAWWDQGRIPMEEYYATHFIVGKDNVGIQLPIRSIEKLSLKIFILVLTRIFGSSLLQQDLRPLMFYAVECFQPTFYEWCTSLLSNMKSQLTD
jgi:hypothetical protein